MHANLTPDDIARLRRLALARAAQLRSEALDDAWGALGRWGARLFVSATALAASERASVRRQRVSWG